LESTPGSIRSALKNVGIDMSYHRGREKLSSGNYVADKYFHNKPKLRLVGLNVNLKGMVEVISILD